MNSTEQAGLFDNIGFLDAESRLRMLPHWPEPERFPVNRPGESVGRIVLDDLKKSPSPLIVTGYASIDRIIGFLSDVAIEGSASVRLVLGNEPFESNTKNFTFRGRAFPDEIRDYWLERGISLFFSAKIIAAMDLIRAGRLEARFVDCDSRRLHAKIYCGADAVTLGSSNFTSNGLDRQLECNTRFHREHDKKRFREASLIAENYWQIGTDYTQDLLALLDQLLRVVTWQEALARACAELLEGEWAARYLEHQLELGDTRLWPSQQLGIAQALWVIENIGSVLVADPTGSGKTRMGAHLVRALVDRMWSKGRARHKARRDISVLVCPPAVEPTWQKEATNCGLPLQIRSHGVLSRQDSEGYEETVAAVCRAQILSIDEAHNFLNLGSKRTQEILANMADSVVLFTATPINRGATDLLSLVDTVVDATLIAAPSSTKNQDKQRDPEMTQTKKGNQWHFGMKAHIGVDAESGLIHTVECTTAKVADITMMDACLHGEETMAFGDRGYHKANRTIEHFEKEGDLSVITPTKKPAGGKLTDEQKAFNRMLSAVRAIVEHPFRVIKRQFGFTKVRYRGLAKNTGQIVTLFALANLWLARRRLLPLVGEVRT